MGIGFFWNVIFFGTRIGGMRHGFFACGVGIFLEHGFDGWDTDFRLRREDFGTRIRRMKRMKRIFSPAAFLDFIEWADLPYVAGPNL
jgi:hypothetical protein